MNSVANNRKPANTDWNKSSWLFSYEKTGEHTWTVYGWQPRPRPLPPGRSTTLVRELSSSWLQEGYGIVSRSQQKRGGQRTQHFFLGRFLFSFNKGLLSLALPCPQLLHLAMPGYKGFLEVEFLATIASIIQAEGKEVSLKGPLFPRASL